MLSLIHDGRRFTYRPTADGSIHFARVLEMCFDDESYPGLRRGKVIACVKIPWFATTFPVAEITST